MKFIAQYSREKFRSFGFDAQIKALAKLLKELEKNIADADTRDLLRNQILDLAPLVHRDLPPRMKHLLEQMPEDPHRLLRALARYHDTALFKDDQLVIRTSDGNTVAARDKVAVAAQITVLADNLRSVFNVGSLFRVCECLGIAELILCGISPDPSHPNMAKTALGTTSRVKWSKQENTLDAISQLKAKGYTIYALETAEPSDSVFEAEYKFPLALVVGNEALGIDPAALRLCGRIVYLPVLGWKNSLNVSVATSVALYQIIFGGKNGDK